MVDRTTIHFLAVSIAVSPIATTRLSSPRRHAVRSRATTRGVSTRSLTNATDRLDLTPSDDKIAAGIGAGAGSRGLSGLMSAVAIRLSTGGSFLLKSLQEMHVSSYEHSIWIKKVKTCESMQANRVLYPSLPFQFLDVQMQVGD